MNTFSEKQLKQYHRDGYILMKNLFNREEIKFLHKSATADRTLDEKSYGRNDGSDVFLNPDDDHSAKNPRS